MTNKKDIQITVEKDIKEQMFEKFGIEKGVYIGEVVDETMDGYPVLDNYKFFTSYKEYVSSVNYYNSNIQDEESFEDWKEYPTLNLEKQYKLLGMLSNIGKISFYQNKYSIRLNGKTYKFVGASLGVALTKMVVNDDVFEVLDKEEVRKILIG